MVELLVEAGNFVQAFVLNDLPLRETGGVMKHIVGVVANLCRTNELTTLVSVDIGYLTDWAYIGNYIFHEGVVYDACKLLFQSKYRLIRLKFPRQWNK